MPYSKTTWQNGSVPAINATNLNNIEDGVASAAYGPDASSGFVPVGDGSGAWVYKKVTNSEVSASAAIDYSKLNLAGSVKNADIATGAGVNYTKLALTNSIVDADIASAANLHKLAGVTGTPDGTKFLRDDGAWAGIPTQPQKLSYVGFLPYVGGSAVWPTANAAILVPFTLQVAQTISKIIVPAGSATSGNFDVGIYDSSGTKKVTKGSTAQSTLTTSNADQVSVSSTALSAGQYYLALAADNTSGAFYFEQVNPNGLALVQFQVASSFPLPSSITVGSTHPTRGVLLAALAT